jgi:predicted Na+-dependent transporter
MPVLLEVVGWCATGALVLNAALQTGPTSLPWAREHWGLVLRFLLAVWLGVPLLTLVVVRLLRVHQLGAATLLLMAICPGQAQGLFLTRSARGRMDAAVILLLATSVTAPLLIPVWARILSVTMPHEIVVPIGRVLGVLLSTAVVPLLLGFAIRRLSAAVAGVLAKVMGALFTVGIWAALAAALIRGAPILPQVALGTFAAVVIVTLGASLMGYLLGRPEIEDRRAAAFAAALGNPALALALVSSSYPEAHASALFAAYVLVRIIILLPLQRWLGRAKHSAPTPV